MNEQLSHLIIFIVSIGAVSTLIFTGHGSPDLESILVSIVGASGVGVVVKGVTKNGNS